MSLFLKNKIEVDMVVKITKNFTAVSKLKMNANKVFSIKDIGKEDI